MSLDETTREALSQLQQELSHDEKLEFEISENLERIMKEHNLPNPYELFAMDSSLEAEPQDFVKNVNAALRQIVNFNRKVRNQLDRDRKKFDDKVKELENMTSIQENLMIAGEFYQAREEFNQSKNVGVDDYNTYLMAVHESGLLYKVLTLPEIEPITLDINDVNKELFG